MGKNANYTGQPIFSQLLKFLPKQKISGICSDLKSDYYVKHFKTYGHLISMLYCSFHHCRSLREVVTGMMACHGKLQHIGLLDHPKRSTLSDANKRRDSQVFERIYLQMLQQYTGFLSDSQQKGRLDNRLFIVDSTTISLFQEILKNVGNKPVNGKRKGGLKAHVLINVNQDVPCLVQMTSAASHDAPFLKDIHLPQGSILVFDKGYRNYKQYQRFTHEGITWVTRKTNASAIEMIETLALNEQQKANGILDDQLIVLGNTNYAKLTRVKARLITYLDPQSGKHLEFITNNTAMSPLLLRKSISADGK